MSTQRYTPEWFVDDLALHATKYRLMLSSEARDLLLSVERYAQELDSWINIQIVLSVFIRRIPDLGAELRRHGFDPVKCAVILERDIEEAGGDKYHDLDEDLYSSDDALANRSLLGSAIIARARMLDITEIGPLDLLAALFDVHDSLNPPSSNVDWSDEALHTPYNTLSHILGWFRRDLWLKVDTIRRDLNLLTPEFVRSEPVEHAPPHVKNGLLSFFADHPHYQKNCFLIMPFRASNQLSEIHTAIKSSLHEEGFEVHRADDFTYSDDLFTNIEIYMHGCRFAVSIHERMTTEQHNANVALEVGYMLGMRKDVCLLKERSLASLPSDLQGRLYVEFDAFSISATVSANIKRWLLDRRLSK